VLAAVLALLPCVFLHMSRWWALAPVFLVNAGLARYFNSKIGGYTGDCLGAGQQVAETVFYLCVSASWTFI
jgi:adenosylcobinamide-GDP ribazoletransferase